MARVFIDGFELGNNELWQVRAGSVVSGAEAAGFSGNYYFQNQGSGTMLNKDTAAFTTIYMMARFKITDTGSRFFAIYGNTARTNFYICRMPDGKIGYYLPDIVNGLTIGSMYLYLNMIYRIEMKWIRSSPYSSSNGTLQVKVNGILDVDYSGNLRTTNYDDTHTRFGACAYAYCDDVVVDSSSWIGNTRIQAIWPDTDLTTAWSCSTGADHSNLIDELPYDEDSTYIYTNSNDQVDDVKTTTLVEGTNPIDAIKCVQVTARSRREGDSTPTKLALGTHLSGGSSAYGSDISLQQSASYYYDSSLFETKPGGGAYTKTDVNNMSLLIKSRA